MKKKTQPQQRCSVTFWSPSLTVRPCPSVRSYLQTVRVDDLVADGTLHQHEVELVLLVLQCVLLASLFAHHTHCGVRQDGLRMRTKQKSSSRNVIVDTEKYRDTNIISNLMFRWNSSRVRDYYDHTWTTTVVNAVNTSAVM